MTNKLTAFMKQYDMVKPGDRVICAVSGGADSMALLWAMYLMKEKLGICLAAAHFNHHLRGAESDRDAAFVKDFCDGYRIPLYMGQGQVQSGKKGLEAAAREARYAFLDSLPGKIATAHTADDNAETVLMHLLRGTGLKGLGGISPVLGNRIRPMLTVTRKEVLAFLESEHLCYVEDSTNCADAYLRNRLRHRVMPLLKEENPRLAENLSQMALGLREDEALLQERQAQTHLSVAQVRQMPAARRARVLQGFLTANGVKEPEMAHIQLAESLVFSENPSARGNFPGGIVISRSYDLLAKEQTRETLAEKCLPCPGQVEYPDLGIRITAKPAAALSWKADCFTVCPVGALHIRSRRAGDKITLSGGTKSLKELFVDKKIPAAQRSLIPVICDDHEVVGLWGVGGNFACRAERTPAVELCFEKIERT